MALGTNSRKSNAMLIAENEVLGVAHLIKLTIVVEGTHIKSYKHFTLSQSVTQHHHFTLILDHDSLGVKEDHHLEKAQKLLGKRILVTFTYKNIPNGPDRDFIGVITKVGLNRKHRNNGDIVLSGYSPTILLDGAPNTQSFGGTNIISLNGIAHRIFVQGLGSDKYPVAIDARYENVAYSCQYEESHYNYLSRLAASYGEQFYYDGTTVRFGRLPFQEQPIALFFGRNVDQVEIAMRALHVKPTYYGYCSATDQKLYTAPSHIKHVSSLGQSAHAIAEETFTAPAIQVASLKARTAKDIEAAQNSMAGSSAVDTFITTGRSSVPFLYPGCVVDMEMLKPDDKRSSYFTRLMITEVHHTVDKLGNYTGTFEAIGGGTGFLPRPLFYEPAAAPQFASVIDNKDALGRIKVRFDWQDASESSEWIRVMTPDAGSSENVSRNRGFVFIPELGDQVMVGFVHGHPDRPYVMGGLFHGKIAAGGYTKNHLKTITTRSGCTIQIDDDDNEGSISITDPSGNSWYMDGNKNISITAPGTINIHAGKDINMTAGENLHISVGDDMHTKVGRNQATTIANDCSLEVTAKYKSKSQNTEEIVMANKESTVGGDLTESTSTTKHTAIGGDITIKSVGVSRLLGAKDAKVNKG